MSKGLKFFVSFGIVSVLMNLAWETAQAQLYEGYVNFWQHFWVCLPMSFSDMALVFALYLAVATSRREAFWITRATRRGVIVIMTLGILVAWGIEYHALITHRWAYLMAMPLIPILNVGLTPVLQMAVLPILSAHIAYRLSGCRKATSLDQSG